METDQQYTTKVGTHISGRELENIQRAIDNPSSFVRSIFDRDHEDIGHKKGGSETISELEHRKCRDDAEALLKVPHSSSCRKISSPKRAVPNRWEVADGYSSATTHADTDENEDLREQMHRDTVMSTNHPIDAHILEPGVYVKLFEKLKWSIPEWMEHDHGEDAETEDIEDGFETPDPSFEDLEKPKILIMDEDVQQQCPPGYLGIMESGAQYGGAKRKLYTYDPLLDISRDPLRSYMRRRAFEGKGRPDVGGSSYSEASMHSDDLSIDIVSQTSRRTPLLAIDKGDLEKFGPSKKKKKGHKPQSIILEQAAAYEGMVDTLTSSELRFCERIKANPVVYLHVKDTLIQHFEEHGPFRKTAAQKMFRMDVNKTAKIYDFIADSGWLQRPP